MTNPDSPSPVAPHDEVAHSEHVLLKGSEPASSPSSPVAPSREEAIQELREAVLGEVHPDHRNGLIEALDTLLAAVSRDTMTENDRIEQRFKTKYGYESPNLDAYIEGILEERMQFWERLQASDQQIATLTKELYDMRALHPENACADMFPKLRARAESAEQQLAHLTQEHERLKAEQRCKSCRHFEPNLDPTILGDEPHPEHTGWCGNQRVPIACIWIQDATLFGCNFYEAPQAGYHGNPSLSEASPSAQSEAPESSSSHSTITRLKTDQG